jgi:aspartyl/asparaginyl beta-hydroxylase (cupin superfamily)
MSSIPTDPHAATVAGFFALREGRGAGARDFFQKAISAGARNPDVWFGLSHAQRMLGAPDEELAALDQALGLDSRYMPALIGKGDWFARTGDVRAADSFYAAVQQLASTLPTLETDLRRQLERISTVRRQFAEAFEGHLRASLQTEGLGQPGTERFSRALDLLLGRRQVYPQQPRHFYFPELPQIEFYPREQFDWAPQLEAATDDIREELRGVLAGRTGIVPYLQTSADRPRFNTNGLDDNPDWSACYLIRNGEVVAENADRCPRTLAALSAAPLCRIDGRTPSVLFSLLQPGTRIPPHNGFMNARLICHLPLIVPSDCAIRVGNDTHVWKEGELVMFDDSIEHEAWNMSRELRVVLIFDIWRPELSPRERTLVSSMLSSINSFGGQATEWVE